MLKKIQTDFEVLDNTQLNDSVTLLKLKARDGKNIPEIHPGQFVNIEIKGADILLRRPISICNYQPETKVITLLIKNQGKGSAMLVASEIGTCYNFLIPLGNGFTLQQPKGTKVLLIGGGVGVAPLYYLAKHLRECGCQVSTLIGARNSNDILLKDEFEKIGSVYISTDDGSAGFKGLITQNSVLDMEWDQFYVCGPLPMMKGIASIASKRGIPCEVSLENKMACGIGACLCCVENTTSGNVCACVEGPVFNIEKLKW